MHKLSAIILAAGSSRRMGINKALLPLGGKTFLENICLALESCDLLEIIVVVNSNFHKSRNLLKNIPQIKWAVNPHPEQGQLSSLLIGMQELTTGTQGVMLCLVDHPLIKLETYHKTIQTWQENSGSIVVPTFKGRTGHPVIFDKAFFQALREIPEGQGARYLVYNNSKQVITFSVDDFGIRKDVDTQEDYMELIKDKDKL
jgi:molybdenum cofactor cytidylyltransferase